MIPSGTTASEMDRRTLVKSQNSVNATGRTRWSWACRSLQSKRLFQQLDIKNRPPLRPGDVVIVEVGSVGDIAHVRTKSSAWMRLHVGDVIIGIIGQQEKSGKRLPITNEGFFEMWSEEGIVGRLPDAIEQTPTRVVLRGVLGDEAGFRINLKNLFFEPARNRVALPPIFLTVGTDTEKGLTESSAGLVNHLAEHKVRASMCRLTGEMSSPDLDEMLSSSATSVRDLAEYGFPSTRGARPVEVAQLFYTLITDASIPRPDVIVGQISDGILNTESQVVLTELASLPGISGVLLLAPTALAAATGVKILEEIGVPIVAIVNTGSGPIGADLEGIREGIPVIESDPHGHSGAEAIMAYMKRLVSRKTSDIRRKSTLRRVEGCGPSSPDRRAA